MGSTPRRCAPPSWSETRLGFGSSGAAGPSRVRPPWDKVRPCGRLLRCNQISGMAPPLQIPQGAQLRLLWNINNQLGINVLGLLITGNPVINQALAETIGSAVKGAYTTNLAPRMAPGTQLVRVGIRDLRSPNLPEFRDTGTIPPGTGTGDPMPNYVCAVATLRTNGSGKSFRGRIYYSGFTEAENTGSGSASAAVGTSIVAFTTAIDTAVTGSGFRLAVLTRPQDDIVIMETTTHSNGTTTTRQLSHQTAKSGRANQVTIIENRNAVWESQRRRVNGRGLLPTLLDATASQTLPS